MPFKSEKQRRFMWSQHPDIAQRWADEGKKKPVKRKAVKKVASRRKKARNSR